MSVALILTLVYFTAVNLFGLSRMYEDKIRMLANQRALPEPALLALAMVGGSIGIAIGVATYRHKRATTDFNRKLTLIIVAQVLVIAGIVVFA